MALVVAPVRRPRLAGPRGRCSRRCRSARSSAASCGWTATSPSRATCWSPACCGAPSSPPPPPSCSRASASRAVPPSATSLAVVAPVTEEATKGAFLLLLLWWRRHELDGVLDGIVYAGMVGIGFAFTENILYLAAAYDGTDGLGPGGTTALTGDLRPALPDQPVRAPLLHRLHRHRRRPRDRLAPPLGAPPGAAGRVRARRARCTACGTPRPSSGTDHFFVVYGTLMLPAFLGVVAFAVYRRRSERPAAGLGPPGRRRPRAAAGHRHPVARRPARPTPRPALGARAGRPAGRARHAGVPGRRHRARLPAPPLPPRHRARTTSRVRGQEHVEQLRRIRPYISFPGQVVPTR